MSAAIPLTELEAWAEAADTATVWPIRSWQALAAAGATGWSVPAEWGGAGLNSVERLKHSEEVAAACLTSALILSQQDAAVRLLVRLAPAALRRRFLPAAARGDAVLTVGVSHLTTSGRHRPPVVIARADGDGFRIDGDIPWVTSADRATAVVAGATLADGREVLFALSPAATGATVEPPLPLAALAGSRTTRVRCIDVRIEPDAVIAGPTERILAGAGGGPDTSALALGLATAAVRFLEAEAAVRPDLTPAAGRLAAALTARRADLHALDAGDGEAVLAVRARCSGLALRAAQAAMVAAKGAGFVRPHPAQRWVRQAAFFLVWSCPRPVTEQLLADLTAGV